MISRLHDCGRARSKRVDDKMKADTLNQQTNPVENVKEVSTYRVVQAVSTQNYDEYRFQRGVSKQVLFELSQDPDFEYWDSGYALIDKKHLDLKHFGRLNDCGLRFYEGSKLNGTTDSIRFIHSNKEKRLETLDILRGKF
jgi:hypothetical protein